MQIPKQACKDVYHVKAKVFTALTNEKTRILTILAVRCLQWIALYLLQSQCNLRPRLFNLPEMKWNSFDFNHASHNFHLTIALSRYDVQVNIDISIYPVCLNPTCSELFTCADWSPMVRDLIVTGARIVTPALATVTELMSAHTGPGSQQQLPLAPAPVTTKRKPAQGTRFLLWYSYYTIITPPLLHYNHTLLSHQAEIRV